MGLGAGRRQGEPTAALGQGWIGRLEMETAGVLVGPCLVFPRPWHFPVRGTPWLCLHGRGTHVPFCPREDPSHPTASLCQGRAWGN